VGVFLWPMEGHGTRHQMFTSSGCGSLARSGRVGSHPGCDGLRSPRFEGGRDGPGLRRGLRVDGRSGAPARTGATSDMVPFAREHFQASALRGNPTEGDSRPHPEWRDKHLAAPNRASATLWSVGWKRHELSTDRAAAAGFGCGGSHLDNALFEARIEDRGEGEFAGSLGAGRGACWTPGPGRGGMAAHFARPALLRSGSGVGDAAWDYRRLDAVADLAALPFAAGCFAAAVQRGDAGACARAGAGVGGDGSDAQPGGGCSWLPAGVGSTPGAARLLPVHAATGCGACWRARGFMDIHVLPVAGISGCWRAGC